MGDVSDIEDLLRAAKKHAARLMWLKTAFVGACAMVGAGVGACRSTVALAALVRQIATKDDITLLEKQYEIVQDERIRADRIQDDRLSALEPRCSDALQCCTNQSNRLDRLTTPGRTNERRRDY